MRSHLKPVKGGLTEAQVERKAALLKGIIAAKEALYTALRT